MVKAVTVMFVLAFSIALTESKATKEEFIRILTGRIKKCFVQEPSKEVVESFLSDTFETRESKCLTACILKELGMVTDGTFNPDSLYDLIVIRHDVSSLEHKKLRDVGEDCAEKFNEAPGDECEKAVKLYQCIDLNNELS